jgi:aryl-alcohol dehydrogenase-like predicted oxidoreductase
MQSSSDEESISTIRAALEAGINFLDTGDFYGKGPNELLVGRAIKGLRDRVLVSVKFGLLRSPLDKCWVLMFGQTR